MSGGLGVLYRECTEENIIRGEVSGRCRIHSEYKQGIFRPAWDVQGAGRLYRN
jgi:hypothetical protein